MTVGEWFQMWGQIVLAGVLVVITGIYAWRTYAISKAMSKQADANLIMAEEVKEQARALKETVSVSVRPFLSIKVFRMARGENKSSAPREIDVEIQNTGKGTARNIEVTCACSAASIDYTEEQVPFLEAGDKWQISLNRMSRYSDTGVKAIFLSISVMYNDDLGELWSSTLRIINENGNWRPEVIIAKRV